MVLDEPPPAVRLSDMSKPPFKYMVYVHFSDYPTHFAAMDDLLTRMWIQLSRAGISPAAVTHDLVMFKGERTEMIEPGPEQLLAEIPLFQLLDAEERQRIVGALEIRTFRSGEAIVREGEEGDSLFMVSGGVVRVSHDLGGKEPLELARLGFGEFFGEISLLTGEKRSASVTALTDCFVLELRKQSLAAIIEARPQLLGRLAEVMAERQVRTEAMVAGAHEAPMAERLRAYTAELVGKMRSFFGVGIDE